MVKTAKRERAKGLTDRAIQSLKVPDGKRGGRLEVFDGNRSCLAVRVTAKGAKSWVFHYRRDGETRRWVIGRYPAITLASARKKAARALVALKDHGIDPAEQKRASRTANSFADLVAAYVKHVQQPPPIGLKSWRESDRILKKLFLRPDWKHRDVKTFRRRDVRDVLEPLGATVSANRALACIRSAFMFAVAKEWIEFNPAFDIDKPVAEQTRDFWLNDDQLRELWAACEASKAVPDDSDDAAAPALVPNIARGLQTILLTAQRPGEVFGMRWSEIDRDAAVWTIPKERTKGARSRNAKDHRVPLTAAVLKLLDQAAADAAQIDAARADSADDVTDDDNKKPNPFVFAGEHRGSVEARSKKTLSALRRAKAISFDCHRHDLRRTAATLMQAAGVPDGHIAKVLNHQIRLDVGRVTAVYTRHPFDAEKRVALETLERRIAAILAAKDQSAANVVPFAR